MIDDLVSIAANLLTCLALLGGAFFMLVGAIGLVRFPDFYTRSHAASKCVTLGMLGLLLALVLFVGDAANHPALTQAAGEARAEMIAEAGEAGERPTTAAVTKALLVVAFVFIAAPVGSHALARAAHRAGVKVWHGTLGDELAEDTGERTRG